MLESMSQSYGLHSIHLNIYIIQPVNLLPLIINVIDVFYIQTELLNSKLHKVIPPFIAQK